VTGRRSNQLNYAPKAQKRDCSRAVAFVRVTVVDWVALAFVLFAAIAGLRAGLLVSGLTAAGIISGAVLGARLAPHLLPDGARAPDTPRRLLKKTSPPSLL
jgi:hypothetical protein